MGLRTHRVYPDPIRATSITGSVDVIISDIGLPPLFGHAIGFSEDAGSVSSPGRLMSSRDILKAAVIQGMISLKLVSIGRITHHGLVPSLSLL